MTLARFRDVYDVDVYVNPALVTFVRKHTDDKTTIWFDTDHSVTVKMEAAAVASALFNAGKP